MQQVKLYVSDPSLDILYGLRNSMGPLSKLFESETIEADYRINLSGMISIADMQNMPQLNVLLYGNHRQFCNARVENKHFEEPIIYNGFIMPVYYNESLKQIYFDLCSDSKHYPGMKVYEVINKINNITSLHTGEEISQKDALLLRELIMADTKLKNLVGKRDRQLLAKNREARLLKLEILILKTLVKFSKVKNSSLKDETETLKDEISSLRRENSILKLQLMEARLIDRYSGVDFNSY